MSELKLVKNTTQESSEESSEKLELRKWVSNLGVFVGTGLVVAGLVIGVRTLDYAITKTSLGNLKIGEEPAQVSQSTPPDESKKRIEAYKTTQKLLNEAKIEAIDKTNDPYTN